MENTLNKHRVCPVERAGLLISPLRRMFLNPRRVLSPFVKSGMSCLDFGCGPGFFTLPMARLTGPSGLVVAVDLQAAMLELLRARVGISGPVDPVPREVIRYHQCSGNRIGSGERFDFILAFHVIHEVPDRSALVREFYDLLNPGGRILVSEPAGHVSRHAFDATCRLMKKNGFRLSAGPLISFSRSVVAERPAT